MNLCVVYVKMMRHNEVASYNMCRQAGSLGASHVGQDYALVLSVQLNIKTRRNRNYDF